MTAVTCEHDISDHERARFEFGEDIFFADTDRDASWLCEIGDSASEECAIFDSIENRKNVLSECFTVFTEKVRETRYTIYTSIWR